MARSVDLLARPLKLAGKPIARLQHVYILVKTLFAGWNKTRVKYTGSPIFILNVPSQYINFENASLVLIYFKLFIRGPSYLCM